MEFDAVQVLLSFLVIVIFVALVKEYQARIKSNRALMQSNRALVEKDRALVEKDRALMQSNFREAIKDFTERKDLLDYIEKANFPDANSMTDVSNQGTNDYLSRERSSRKVTSAEGVIRLSNFRRSMISNAKPRLIAYHFDTVASTVRNIVLRKLFSNVQEVCFSCCVLTVILFLLIKYLIAVRNRTWMSSCSQR